MKLSICVWQIVTSVTVGYVFALVKVIVTVFGPEQEVIGTDTTLVEAQSLAPGETSTFRVQFAELGGMADTYLSTVQASLVP